MCPLCWGKITLVRTRWYRHNGFFGYGPLYYRLAHSILLTDPLNKVSNLDDSYVRDKSGHIALMLVSLLSVIALVVVVAILSVPWWAGGWVALLMLFCILGASELWMDMTVDNHPDVLLTLLVALATWLTITSVSHANTHQHKWYLWASGAVWGLAMLTKPSAIMFIAAAVMFVVVWSVSSKRKLLVSLDLLHIGGAMVLTYMLVGFPQSLDVKGLYNFLQWHADKTTGSPDWVYWKDTLIPVALAPVLALAAAVLIFERLEGKLEGFRASAKTITVGLVIPLVGFIALFPMSFQSHRRYYILPVMGCLLIWFIPLFKQIVLFAYSHLRQRFHFLLPLGGVFLMLVAVGKASAQYFPNTSERLYARFQFQREAEEVQREISRYIENGKAIIADPYVPLDVRKTRIPSPTNFTKKMLSEFLDAEVYVSSKWYYERFLHEEQGSWTALSTSEENYKASRDFYREVDQSEMLFDDLGRSWSLRLRTPIGWGIWEKASSEPQLSSAERQKLNSKRSSYLKDILLDMKLPRTSNNKTVDRFKLAEGVKIDGPGELSLGPRANLNSLVIEGQEPYTRISAPPSTLKLKRGTFALWARLEDPKKGNAMLVSANSVEGMPRSIYLDRNGVNGKFNLIFNGVRLDTDHISVPSSKWHHYALTWKDHEQQFYIDGVLVARGRVPLPSTDARTFFIGWLGEGKDTNQWYGELSEVVTFGRNLSADEISALYRVGIRD